MGYPRTVADDLTETFAFGAGFEGLALATFAFAAGFAGFAFSTFAFGADFPKEGKPFFGLTAFAATAFFSTLAVASFGFPPLVGNLKDPNPCVVHISKEAHRRLD